MYSKEEASKIRQQFWITFGKYMKPIPSAEGLPINWINYKTGVKHLFFKMDADQKLASIAIELTHAEDSTRGIFYEKFKHLKPLFHELMGEEWEWAPTVTNEFGVPLSRIQKTLRDESIYSQENWPALISFLKQRIIALDQFWSDVKPLFEAL